MLLILQFCSSAAKRLSPIKMYPLLVFPSSARSSISDATAPWLQSRKTTSKSQKITFLLFLFIIFTSPILFLWINMSFSPMDSKIIWWKIPFYDFFLLSKASCCRRSSSAIHSSTVAPFKSSLTIRQVLPHCSISILALDAST